MPYTQDNSPSTDDGQDQSGNPTTVFPTPARGHVVALAVTLTVVAIIMVAAIAYFTARMRRVNTVQDQSRETNVNKSTTNPVVLDLRHPASPITPFSMREPGSKMRIASRRQDGAWDFADPETPFSPNGVMDPLISPLSPSTPVRSTIKAQVTEERTRECRKRETSNSHASGLEPPPPAYCPEDRSDEAYIHGKN